MKLSDGFTASEALEVMTFLQEEEDVVTGLLSFPWRPAMQGHEL